MAWRCFSRRRGPAAFPLVILMAAMSAAPGLLPVLALACLIPLPGPWAPAMTAVAAEADAADGAGAPQLECRLQAGPWQRCRMEVEQLGSRWWLVVGDQRIGFRHDGRGSVRMQWEGGAWQPVTARWDKDTNLCWDGVCARGDLPLD